MNEKRSIADLLIDLLEGIGSHTNETEYERGLLAGINIAITVAEACGGDSDG